MRKLVLKMQMSVDGYACGPDGEVDWIFPSMDGGATAWLVDTLWQAGVHVMGRETYTAMAAHWPQSTDPFAAPMNAIPKFVFSKTLEEAPWEDSFIVDGDLEDEITRLKRLPGRDLLAHGGVRFARSLVKLGLVDEYRLMVHPVVLGGGKTIFDELGKRRAMALMGTRQFAGGACAYIYHPTVGRM